MIEIKDVMKSFENKNVLKQMGINSSKISVKDTQSKIYNEILKLVK